MCKILDVNRDKNQLLFRHRYSDMFLLLTQPSWSTKSYLKHEELKKLGQYRPLFVYFRHFLDTISLTQIEKSIDGVLGI